MTRVSDELVERMVALVRLMAAPQFSQVPNYYAMAAKIVAELPAPVDPDLLLAREVAGTYDYEPDGFDMDERRAEVRAGKRDEWACVQVALAAIKRVRAEGQA